MDVTKATAAGALAAQVTQLQGIVVGLQGLLDHGAVAAGDAIFFDPVAGGNITVTFPRLTPAESAAVLTGALAIFQARLDAANAQLAAL